MANGYGAGGAVASYPSSGFPAVNFLGAGIPGRSGLPSSTAGGATAPGPLRGHTIIGLIIVVAVAYGLWHLSAKV
jgi:hypothetical protein